MELYKLKPEQRPRKFMNGAWHVLDLASEVFQVPLTWDYADD